MELNIDKLTEIITKEIIKRLNGRSQKAVYAPGGCPPDMISKEYEVKEDTGGGDHGCGGCGYVLLTAEAYLALCGGDPAVGCCGPEPAGRGDDGRAGKRKTLDLACKRLLHERDLRENDVKRGDVINVSKRTIITALAHDYAKNIGAEIVKV